MHLITQPNLEQAKHWPRTGRHILAQYDHRSTVVYQAYRPNIGHWAVQHQGFGGPSSALVV
jgi:hypothetical protein